MADYRLNNFTTHAADRKINFILPACFVWGFALILILAFFLYENESDNILGDHYLLPWCLLTGAVIAAPSVYLYYKNSFNLFHPLVFAAWSYFFPAFFVGGLVLSAGFSQPFFLNFVQDERYNMPLTLVYVMLGYIGLSVGFFLPFGRKIGEKINRWMPEWNWKPEQVMIPGLVLLALGLFNTIFAFAAGVIGFQQVEEIGIFDGTIFLLTLFWLEAAFLLWLIVFRAPKLGFNHYLVIGLLLAISLSKSALQGNRGSLIQVFILIAFAFVSSGRTIKFQHKMVGGILLTLALLIGMIYGTTFRNIKQSQERVSVDEYIGNIFESFGKISDQGVFASMEEGLVALAERIDAVSSLAVVVSNYEKLAPYEESYGLDNNIWKDSITFLIPRIVWNDKPLATDPSKYGDLYFNFSENSFTLTPIGDLLRNFGPIGIPLGMIILGFFVRIFYAALIENQGVSFWRATLYYMLLTSISYEGSYGLIIPYLLKVGFIAVLGLIIVWFFVRKGSFKRI
jgi:hypothetical protein